MTFGGTRRGGRRQRYFHRAGGSITRPCAGSVSESYYAAEDPPGFRRPGLLELLGEGLSVAGSQFIYEG